MLFSTDRPHLVRCEHDGAPVWGLLEHGQVYRVNGSPFAGAISSDRQLLVSLDEARLLAPAVPSKIICVGRNYVAHAAEHKVEVPTEPLLFLKPPSSVIGPGQAIVLPAQSQQVEHEAELAVVIGQRCRNVPEELAWRHVLGVTCGNDVTARDLQRRDSQWTRGKGFDTFCPLGPVLCCGLSAADVADLQVSCRVDGSLRQQGRTSEMVFSPAFLIAYISSVMTLEPGDVLLTGTPAGVGRLQPGETVEVAISGIGTLTNPVQAS